MAGIWVMVFLCVLLNHLWPALYSRKCLSGLLLQAPYHLDFYLRSAEGCHLQKIGWKERIVDASLPSSLPPFLSLCTALAVAVSLHDCSFPVGVLSPMFLTLNGLQKLLYSRGSLTPGVAIAAHDFCFWGTCRSFGVFFSNPSCTPSVVFLTHNLHV